MSRSTVLYRLALLVLVTSFLAPYAMVSSDVMAAASINQLPSVDAGADATINEGEIFSRLGSFIDPDADTWTATADYGDGSESQQLALNPDKTFNLSHPYADDGQYTVTVVIIDSAGETGSDEIIVTVNNVAPTITEVTNSGPVDVGIPAKIFVKAIDPAQFNDALSHEYDCDNDGNYEIGPSTVYDPALATVVDVTLTQSGFSPSTVIVDANTFVSWRNDSGEQASVNSDPHPTNHAYPVLNNGLFDDGWSVSSWMRHGGTFTYHNHLNPSQVGTIIVAPSCTFDEPGEHQVNVRASDEDGGQVTDSTVVTVTGVNQAPVANAGTDQSVTDADGDDAESVTLDGQESSDPDGTITAYRWLLSDTELGTTAVVTTSLPVGSHSITLEVTDNGGSTASDTVSITVSASSAAIALPGRFEAEDYREGGEGVGYHDTTTGNTGGAYRSDSVDIQTTADSGGGFVVGWIDAGESLSYDVSVDAAREYIFTVRVASPFNGKSLHLELDGIDVSGSITVPNTGGWQTWTDVTVGPVSIATGSYTLKVVMETNGFNLNYVEVSEATPESWDVVFALPSRIEVEDYRDGVGYHDTTAGNIGGTYRTDDVDIQATQDTGASYTVGWIGTGEWLAYNVSVATSGEYTFTARVATPLSNKSLHIELNGMDVTSSIAVPNTGGWHVWTSVTTRSVQLDAGSYELRVIMETDGFNLNYITVEEVTTDAVRPSVTGVTPSQGAVDVALDAGIVATVNLPSVGQGVDGATLTVETVKLLRASDNAQIPANLNTSGGGDVIVLQPAAPLESNTTYTFEVTDGVKDLSGAAFLPFSSTFTTGTGVSGDDGSLGGVEFEQVDLSTATNRRFSGVTIGPDGKLYAGVISGRILRFTMNADGTLGEPQVITTLRTANGGDRMLIGLAFDPSSTADNLTLWVSHSAFVFNNGPDWAGKISKMSGPNLETVQDIVVGLPRSIRDHVTNGLTFGPDGALYVLQGSNTGMGAPDDAWGNRPERLLSAALLRIDTTSISGGPVDVKTEDGGSYDPFAVGAPVTIYASGLRNAYDLLWHSNGSLYVPTNGGSSGGKVPSTPGQFPDACQNRVDDVTNGDYNGPAVVGIDDVNQSQHDFLFRVVEGGYYGHPNPARCEWVMNGGNPTDAADLGEVNQYQVGTQPDRNWRGFAFDFGPNKSPNGVIEYTSSVFGGALQGKLLVVRYSVGKDIIVLALDNTGNIASSTIGVSGFTGFTNPVDLIENPTNGHIYVADYETQTLMLLRPLDNVSGSE